MTYDLEDLLFDIRDMLKSNLNTEILAVNTEKVLKLDNKSIPDNAYCVQSLDDKIMNYDDFVFIEAVDIQSVGLGPATSQTFSIATIIVSGGKANQLEQARRMFRYGRALKQTFEKYWNRSGGNFVKFKIESIPPQDYQDINATKYFKTVGVLLTGSLA